MATPVLALRLLRFQPLLALLQGGTLGVGDLGELEVELFDLVATSARQFHFLSAEGKYHGAGFVGVSRSSESKHENYWSQ